MMVNLEKLSDPGVLYVRQKINLTTIPRRSNTVRPFDFCPLNNEVVIALRSNIPVPPLSKNQVDERIFSFPYLKAYNPSSPSQLKSELKYSYPFESIAFDEAPKLPTIRQMKCLEVLQGFQVIATDSIDTGNAKLLTYKVRSEKNDPLNRLITVTNINNEHNYMTQLGFDDRGLLWTITFNSAKTNPPHLFSNNPLTGNKIRVYKINSFNQV